MFICFCLFVINVELLWLIIKYRKINKAIFRTSLIALAYIDLISFMAMVYWI